MKHGADNAIELQRIRLEMLTKRQNRRAQCKSQHREVALVEQLDCGYRTKRECHAHWGRRVDVEPVHKQTKINVCTVPSQPRYVELTSNEASDAPLPTDFHNDKLMKMHPDFHTLSEWPTARVHAVEDCFFEA